MKYAICNETFEGWQHQDICRTIASLGYKGLEIAPFTLAPTILEVDTQKRKTLRHQAEEEGIAILGLHWLLAKTIGLHLTSPETETRQKTAQYLVDLAQCCHDLGGNILVFGSPAQRRIPKGASWEQTRDYAVDTFSRAMPAISDLGVDLCLEPLAPAEADFINTCAEATDILNRLDHPHARLHLDVKAMSSEAISIPDLIRKYASRTGHFHANDPNLRGPGFGEMDFVPIFQALKDCGYEGWISVEVFDYKPDPVTIARQSMEYMKKCASRLV